MDNANVSYEYVAKVAGSKEIPTGFNCLWVFP